MVVLIVEDDGVIGLDLEAILRADGHEVTGPAVSAAQALTLAAREPPAVAVLDVNLGGRADGLALAHTLQERYGCAIVFVTGQPYLVGDRGPSASVVIAKPYHPKAVLAAVRSGLCSGPSGVRHGTPHVTPRQAPPRP